METTAMTGGELPDTQDHASLATIIADASAPAMSNARQHYGLVFAANMVGSRP
jgi:hypothetical protein